MLVRSEQVCGGRSGSGQPGIRGGDSYYSNYYNLVEAEVEARRGNGSGGSGTRIHRFCIPGRELKRNFPFVCKNF